MRFGSAASSNDDVERACEEAADAALAQLEGARADLCLLFVTSAMAGKERAGALVADRVGASCLVGATGNGVIGGGIEVEGRPAVSVTVASLPGSELSARHLSDGDLPGPDDPPSAWVECVGADPATARAILVFPEPFGFSPDRLLAGLDFAFPRAPKAGGIASGSQHPEGHVLFLGGRPHTGGAVVLTLSGAIQVDTVVAQGCKPFGRPGRITIAENHYLTAIDGKPALEFLQEQLQTLGEQDRELARSTPLFLGIAMDPFATQPPGPGDYLIRNVLGYDPESGILSIGEMLSVGRLVQFHMRDHRSAAQELRVLLRHAAEPAPAGALLFSCTGRGRHMYGIEGHDSRVFTDTVGPVPLGGFFCNGEIGPVQGVTHLHGYTSVFALMREPSA